jgi:general secretion pathway protein K
MPMRNKHQGVALIMVLLAMALIIMLATGMVREQSLWVFKASHHKAQQQGYSIALGAETLGRQMLIRDFEDDQDEDLMIDSLDERWAIGAAILPLDENGVVEVQIDGLGGRINLNELVTPAGKVDQLTRSRVQRLLQALGITGISVNALIDWIDEDDQPTGAAGAEDSLYLTEEPSYRAGNQPFVSISELRLIAGMTESAYETLRPHVVVLPVTGSGINVNTASAPVLMSLHENLTEAIAGVIIEKREEARFESIKDFLSLPELAGMGLTSRGLTLKTSFFDVVCRITYDNRKVNMVSRVFRSAKGEVQTVHRDLSQNNRITREPYTLSEG